MFGLSQEQKQKKKKKESLLWQRGYQILIKSCKYAVKVAELMVTSLFDASVMFERTEIYLDADQAGTGGWLGSLSYILLEWAKFYLNMTMGKLAGNYNKLHDWDGKWSLMLAVWKLLTSCIQRISRLYSKWFFVDALAEKLHELI